MDGTATVKQLKSSLAPSRRRRAQPKPTLDAVPASTESVPQDEPKDRKSIAIDILVQGYVLSYVDFFYLTHRPDPNPGMWRCSLHCTLPYLALTICIAQT